MRTFLQDYRLNVVGLFKKYIGMNGQVTEEARKPLDRVVQDYVALMTMADFIEVSLDYS